MVYAVYLQVRRPLQDNRAVVDVHDAVEDIHDVVVEGILDEEVGGDIVDVVGEEDTLVVLAVEDVVHVVHMVVAVLLLLVVVVEEEGSQR